jgi:hypothetical protein
MTRRIKPINTLDKASMIHDIEYLRGNQWKADNNMWSNIIKENPLYAPIANLTRGVFLIKDLVGYNTDRDLEDYSQLRDIAERDYDLNRMSFYN